MAETMARLGCPFAKLPSAANCAGNGPTCVCRTPGTLLYRAGLITRIFAGEAEKTTENIHSSSLKNSRCKKHRVLFRIPMFLAYNRFPVGSVRSFPAYPRLHGWQIRDGRVQREESRHYDSLFFLTLRQKSTSL